MINSENPNFNGIRAENETDRSAEFKESRDKLAGEVNGWLANLAAKRDRGEALESGLTIMDRPRIIRTMLGRTATGTGSMMTEMNGGISLEGDGVETRFDLQAVLPSEDGKGIRVIEATGSDPLDRLVNGDEYAPRGGNATDVSFKVTEEIDGQVPTHFGYEVGGDGAMRRKFVDARGYNTSQQLSTAEDAHLALVAFEQAQAEIG